MSMLQSLKNEIISGKLINKEEALLLLNAPLEELCTAADEIREKLCGNDFDVCTIINGKSGRCSENCKYCAQSAFYETKVEEYALLQTDEIVAQAKYNEERGVLRYSIVTSGRNLNDQEMDQVCESIKGIKKESNISVCVSFGLLKEEQFRKLREVGVVRVHNNLEASKNYFPNICTTHTYDDKIASIKAAKNAGLSVCSGGIMGLGESMEDRVDMAFSLRDLGVSSVPINILNPIPGTPLEKNKVLTNDEVCRIVAMYRFILPNIFIRLAGGRGLLPDKGRQCLMSGANAVISGDMLTTAGVSIKEDMKMIGELGYQVRLKDE